MICLGKYYQAEFFFFTDNTDATAFQSSNEPSLIEGKIKLPKIDWKLIMEENSENEMDIKSIMDKQSKDETGDEVYTKVVSMNWYVRNNLFAEQKWHGCHVFTANLS